MTKSILEKAMAPEVLNESWRRLRNEHTPWTLHVSRDEMHRNLLKYILTCREKVLSGKYRPEPLRQFTMEKPNGKKRVLTAQYLMDKFVQRAILIVLEPRAEAIFHDDSYAYRPGRSVTMALNKVRERIRIGQAWLVDADITQFFDSIPHQQLVKDLKRFLGDATAMRLIGRWLVQGAHHQSMLGKRRGISQGAILSPLFCNLYLDRFDKQLVNANISFVRFADDFLLFSRTRQAAISARDYAATALKKLGLELHPEKTQIVRSGPSVQFLGEKLPNP